MIRAQETTDNIRIRNKLEEAIIPALYWRTEGRPNPIIFLPDHTPKVYLSQILLNLGECFALFNIKIVFRGNQNYILYKAFKLTNGKEISTILPSLECILIKLC